MDATSDRACRGVLGMCVLAAAGDGSATTVILRGSIRADSVFPTFSSGEPVYASINAGEVDTAYPTATGEILRIIGHGTTNNELLFNPSNDYYELA